MDASANGGGGGGGGGKAVDDETSQRYSRDLQKAGLLASRTILWTAQAEKALKQYHRAHPSTASSSSSSSWSTQGPGKLSRSAGGAAKPPGTTMTTFSRSGGGSLFSENGYGDLSYLQSVAQALLTALLSGSFGMAVTSSVAAASAAAISPAAAVSACVRPDA